MLREAPGPAAAAAAAILSCAAVVAGAPAVVMIAGGLVLLAGPGYVWARVLFGARLDRLPFVLVATGIALAVPVLGGVALDVVGIPLHRPAWAILLASLTLAGAIVMVARSSPGTPRPQAGQRRPVRNLLNWQVAAFAAAAVIAAGGVGLARTGAAIQPQPGFTQLWLVPPHVKDAAAVLHVSNHEGTAERYRLVVQRTGRVSASWSFTLPDGQTWRGSVRSAGARSITADLYRLPDRRHPYRHVRISGRALAALPVTGGRTP